jgi:putative Holliday junction resolvase
MPALGPAFPVLALDYGERRIGVAVSDADGKLALPAPALLRGGGPAQDLAALKQLAQERGIRRIVVGLPIRLDGRAGPEAEAARAFARALAAATGLEVEMLDERWSTREAERALRESEGGSGRRRRARKSGAVDSAAAALLLQTWLARAAGAAGANAAGTGAGGGDPDGAGAGSAGPGAA